MTKRTVLLLNPPYKERIIRDNYCCFTSKSGYIWPPVDLLYLSGVLNDKNINLIVVEAIGDDIDWEEVYRRVDGVSIDYCFCLTGTVSFEEDMVGLNTLKKLNPKGKFFVLGNTPTFRPKQFLAKYKFLEGVVHNFMDSRVKEYVLGERKYINSLSWRRRDNTVKVGSLNCFKRGHVLKIDSAPQYRLFPLAKYHTPLSKRKPITTALLTYGCPFKCSFCIASAISLYERDLVEIEKEFDEMKRVGIKEIFFQDSTFNVKPVRLLKILDLMIRKDYQFSWSANVHSYYLIEELLERMKEAGCHTVQLGIESGSQDILNKYAPSKRLENIRTVVDRCKSVGIRVLGYYIIGFPGETEFQVNETIDMAVDLDTDFVSFSVMTPDYGTKLFEEVSEGEALGQELKSFDSSDMAVLGNASLSIEDQDRLIKKAYTKFYLRPSKILQYLLDFPRLGMYVSNGIWLIKKTILRH